MKTNINPHLRLIAILFLTIQISPYKSMAQGPSPIPYAVGAVPTCMKTILLPIHTGVNWRTGNLYAPGAQDEYWSLEKNDNGSAPICAYSYQSNWGTLSGTNAISATSNPTGPCSINGNIWGNKKSGHDLYRFRRHVWVDLPGTSNIPCALSLNIMADDKIDDVSVNGVSLGFSTSATSAGSLYTWTPSISLHGGDNYIDIDILNIEFGSGGISNMMLDIFGTISTGNLDIVNNMHYVPNTSYFLGSNSCALNNVYLEKPDLATACIQLPNTSGPLLINNFFPNFTYVLSPGAIPITSSSYNVNVGTTYTVSASDGFGCTLASTITPTNSPKVNLQAIPKCVAPGSFSTIVTSLLNYDAPPYSYSINSGSSNNTGIFSNLTPGIYTVVVTDGKNCTGSSITAVGNVFTASMNASPPCINSTTNSLLTVSTYPFQTNYTFASPPSGTIVYNGLLNTCTANTVGIYTVTVTDAAGCTASSTVTIGQAANISFTISPCITPGNFSITVNASGTPGPYQYKLNSGTYQTSNVFNGVSGGTYTVTVLSANGCTASNTFTTPPVLVSCCNPQLWAEAVATSTYYNNTTTATIAGTPLPFTLNTSAKIVIDGILLVDNDFTFFTCPNILFGPNAQIIMTNNHTLSIENSTLSAACSEMWRGILATNSTETVKISKSSLIRDMSLGIEMNGSVGNAPVLQCEGTTFRDNIFSIVFINTTPNYTGFVRSNKFESTSAMLPPATRMRRAISIFNCEDIEIGGLNPGNVGSGNKFVNMDNGIFISGNRSSFTLVSNVRLNNNVFTDITGGMAINGNQNIYNNIYSNDLGCAIYAKNYSSKLIKANMTLTIDNNNIGYIPHIDKCSKGVVTYNINTNIARTNVVNTGGGFMNTMIDGKMFQISYNQMNNVIYGMEFTGNNAYGSSVLHNQIHLPSVLPWAMGSTNDFFTPIGIGLTRVSPTYTANFDIVYNDIYVPCEAGIGINLRNTGEKVRVIDNKIFHTCVNPYGLSFTGIPYFYGIQLTNSKSSSVKLNTITGNANTLAYYGDNTGVKLNKSIGLHLYCNTISSTRYGILAVSNCTTAPTEVMGNAFDGQLYGILFRHLGSEGTLGNPIGLQPSISQNGFDPNNTFAGSNYIAGKRLFKMSVCIGAPPQENYYTSPLTLNNSQSSGNHPSCVYFLQSNGSPVSVLNCANVFPSIQPPGGSDHDHDIARGTSVYAEFDGTAQWIDKQELFERLRLDSLMTSSDPILDSFYNAMLNTDIDNIDQTNFDIRALLDSLSLIDPVLFDQRLQQARYDNNNIVSADQEAINEQMINNIYLKVVDLGIDSITSTEDSIIQAFALGCPFVFGTATYKARQLYAIYNPGVQYNDIDICNNVGLFKGNSLFTEENSYLNGLNAPTSIANLIEGEVRLYPNPASDNITIAYKLTKGQTASLILYDMVGRERKVIALSDNVNRVQTSINDLEAGIYAYSYSINRIQKSTGKLIIK